MNANNQTLSVAELIEKQVLFIGDGYRAKNSEFGISGIPFVRIGDISDNGELDVSESDLFPIKDLHKVGNKISQTGDIVFTSKGSVGRFIFVKANTPKFIYSPQLSFWRVLNSNVVIPRFLIYWMRGTEFQQQVHGLKSQTDMADYVSLSDQRRMKITLPYLPIQRRIAEILGRLDDKIEVNRRINRTLEAMAQALYKHWFVDFGPFQDGEFVESELGLIPKGWEVANLGSVAEVVSGSTPSTKVNRYWEGGEICWATPTDMTALKSPVILDTERKITSDGLNNSSASLLPVGSVLVTSRATLGVVAIACVPIATNQGFKSIVCGPKVTNHFMLLFIQNNQEELVNRANGSVFLEINATNFKAIPIIVPPLDTMTLFDKTVEQWYKQIYMNEIESRKLTEIRDYLLPKLLSGEISVEAAMAEVQPGDIIPPHG